MPDGLVGVYRVVEISENGQTVTIEKFDVSKQKPVGDPTRTVAINRLALYEENSSQAAGRILREAITED